MAVNTLSFNQVSTVLQSLVEQATGQSVLTPTNTGDFVSVGKLILSTDTGLDRFMNALSGVIGRTLFSIRPYSSKMNSLEKDSWTWGSYMRKLSIADTDWADDAAYKYPVFYDASQTSNPTGDGLSVDQWAIHKPDLLQTTFFGQSIFSDWVTLPDSQLVEAFTGPEEFAQFLSMLTQNLTDKHEQAKDVIKHGLVSNLIGSLVKENNTNRVVHVITEYNSATGMTGEEGAITSETVYLPENFNAVMKWLYARIQSISDKMTERSEMFQTVISSKPVLRHTPLANQRLLLYSPAMHQFTDMVLADTHHKNLLSVDNIESVNYWQSMGTPDKISVYPSYTHTDGTVKHDTTNKVEKAGILGVLYDEAAIAMTTLDGELIPTPLNARGKYRNIFLHARHRVLQDNTEKAVVFIMD